MKYTPIQRAARDKKGTPFSLKENIVRLSPLRRKKQKIRQGQKKHGQTLLKGTPLRRLLFRQGQKNHGKKELNAP